MDQTNPLNLPEPGMEVLKDWLHDSLHAVMEAPQKNVMQQNVDRIMGMMFLAGMTGLAEKTYELLVVAKSGIDRLRPYVRECCGMVYEAIGKSLTQFIEEVNAQVDQEKAMADMLMSAAQKGGFDARKHN